VGCNLGRLGGSNVNVNSRKGWSFGVTNGSPLSILSGVYIGGLTGRMEKFSIGSLTVRM